MTSKFSQSVKSLHVGRVGVGPMVGISLGSDEKILSKSQDYCKIEIYFSIREYENIQKKI